MVDLSHGVNYQAVSVLYATAAIIRDFEDKLLIFNSDPYPADAQTPQCVDGVKTGASDKRPAQDPPPLALNDVTRLQQAVRRVRHVVALRRFQTPEKGQGGRDKAFDQLLAYICALANGAPRLVSKALNTTMAALRRSASRRFLICRRRIPRPLWRVGW